MAKDEIVTVQSGTLASGPVISGSLEASRGATLVARVGGTVASVGPDLGDRVRVGTVLARIEENALGSTVESAKAALSAAKEQLQVERKEHERDQHLVTSGAIPARDAETSAYKVRAQESAVAQAKAQLDTASSQLGDTVIKAPIDGVVARRAVKAGDVVAPGAQLYELIDPSSLRLNAQVPSDRLADVKIGTQLSFMVRGFAEKAFVGTIARIAPAADPNTRQLPILVDIPNVRGELRAGLFAQGRLFTESQQGVIVPSSAIDETSERPSVLRVTGDKIERVFVQIGLRDVLTDRVIVTGIQPGDRIVLRAAAAPAPGTSITVS